MRKGEERKKTYRSLGALTNVKSSKSNFSTLTLTRGTLTPSDRGPASTATATSNGAPLHSSSGTCTLTVNSSFGVLDDSRSRTLCRSPTFSPSPPPSSADDATVNRSLCTCTLAGPACGARPSGPKKRGMSAPAMPRGPWGPGHTTWARTPYSMRAQSGPDSSKPRGCPKVKVGGRSCGSAVQRVSDASAYECDLSLPVPAGRMSEKGRWYVSPGLKLVPGEAALCVTSKRGALSRQCR